MVYQQTTSGGGSIIRDFFFNRPPTVMFLLCLASCALATMSISFYFKWTDEPIHNPDVLGWNTLLTEVSKMNFCLLNSTSFDLLDPSNDKGKSRSITSTNTPSISHQPLVFDRTLHKDTKANVSLLLPMSAKIAQSLQSAPNGKGKYKGDILASTEISLRDMSRAVPPYYHHYTISVMVNVPSPVNTNSSGGKTDVDDEENVYACFNIEAPLSLLQDLNSSRNLPKECIIPRSNVASKLLAHTGDHLPPSWCNQNGAAPIKLEYFEDQPSWTVYIATADKNIINLHLMATSVFLFALLGVIVLVIFVKGSFVSRKLHSQRYSTEMNNSDLPLTTTNSG